MSLTKAKGLFRNSRAPFWLSGPMYRLNPPLKGPVDTYDSLFLWITLYTNITNWGAVM
jgi:hypothetical protein